MPTFSSCKSLEQEKAEIRKFPFVDYEIYFPSNILSSPDPFYQEKELQYSILIYFLKTNLVPQSKCSNLTTTITYGQRMHK